MFPSKKSILKEKVITGKSDTNIMGLQMLPGCPLESFQETKIFFSSNGFAFTLRSQFHQRFMSKCFSALGNNM